MAESETGNDDGLISFFALDVSILSDIIDDEHRGFELSKERHPGLIDTLNHIELSNLTSVAAEPFPSDSHSFPPWTNIMTSPERYVVPLASRSRLSGPSSAFSHHFVMHQVARKMIATYPSDQTAIQMFKTESNREPGQLHEGEILPDTALAIVLHAAKGPVENSSES